MALIKQIVLIDPETELPVTYDIGAEASNIEMLDGLSVEETIAAILETIENLSPKVPSPINGNLVGMDGEGTLTNSGIAGNDVITKVSGAGYNNVPVFDSNGKIVDSNISSLSIATKTIPSAAGNIATLNSDGSLGDSGIPATNVYNVAIDPVSVSGINMWIET